MEKPIFIKKTRKNEKRCSWLGLYKCHCGNEFETSCTSVNTGATRSCGCIRKQNAKTLAYRTCSTHNMTKTRMYRIYYGIKQRCEEAKNVNYLRYGARGIKNLFTSFEMFRDWAVSSGYTDNLTIDRIDNNGNYEPSNCRWVDRKVQAQNRRTNFYIVHNGEKKCAEEWSRITGINSSTIRNHINMGKSLQEIVDNPPINGNIFIKLGSAINSCYKWGALLKIDHKFIMRRFNKGLSHDEIERDVVKKLVRNCNEKSLNLLGYSLTGEKL